MVPIKAVVMDVVELVEVLMAVAVVQLLLFLEVMIVMVVAVAVLGLVAASQEKEVLCILKPQEQETALYLLQSQIATITSIQYNHAL
jgi:hypothetical protein